MTRLASLFLTGAVCLFLAACGGGGGASSMANQTAAQSSAFTGAAGNAVTIKDFAYAPHDLTVTKGTTVTFTNQDSTNHTATSTGQNAFDTGTIGKGQAKTVTLDIPGTFSYVCSFHPFMHGSITVKP